MGRRLVIAALTAFLVADVVLVSIALRRGGPSASTSMPSRVQTSASVASSPTDGSTSNTSTASASALTSSSPPSAGTSMEARGFLAVSADGAVIRASSGGCESVKPPVAQLSTDRGASFTSIDQGVTQILRVVATSTSDIWFIGTDNACTPTLHRTRDGGATWQTEAPTGAWYLDVSADSAEVQAPTRRSKPGCAPIGITVLDDATAFVGCPDGQIRGTTDGGATWTPLAPVPGLVSLAFSDPSKGFALATISDCAVALFTSVDGGKSWSGTSCLSGTRPQAVDVVGQNILAQVDGALQRSTDGGASWVPAG